MVPPRDDLPCRPRCCGDQVAMNATATGLAWLQQQAGDATRPLLTQPRGASSPPHPRAERKPDFTKFSRGLPFTLLVACSADRAPSRRPRESPSWCRRRPRWRRGAKSHGLPLWLRFARRCRTSALSDPDRIHYSNDEATCSRGSITNPGRVAVRPRPPRVRIVVSRRPAAVQALRADILLSVSSAMRIRQLRAYHHGPDMTPSGVVVGPRRVCGPSVYTGGAEARPGTTAG